MCLECRHVMNDLQRTLLFVADCSRICASPRFDVIAGGKNEKLVLGISVELVLRVGELWIK